VIALTILWSLVGFIQQLLVQNYIHSFSLQIIILFSYTYGAKIQSLIENISIMSVEIDTLLV